MYLQTYSFLFYFVRFLDPQLKKINVEFAGAMGANVKHEEGYLTGDLSQNQVIKVMRVGSVTFCNPCIQKTLQNWLII